jgi:hypothetical protein
VIDKISLKEAELKAFRISFEDGMLDVFLGSVVMMFAVAPLLGKSLGDFWASAVFLPFYGVVYLAILLIRKFVVTPRRGQVKPGPVRRKRLFKFTIIMLIINSVSLILGLIAALTFNKSSGAIMTGIFGLMVLMAFSAAAYFLDYPRLYVYGLICFIAPIVGQYLYENYGASHHGYPITYGITSGLMVIVGLITFIRFLIQNPALETPAEGV